MKELLNIKNKVRDVIRKYEEIIFPVLRLIWCFVVFTNIHSMFHYMDLFDRKLVIFLLAVLCAVVPDWVFVFAAGAMIGVNCFSVNIEVGLAFAVVFMVMYCMYIRFFPKFAYAIFLVPICYAFGMPYLAPMLIIVITGLGGALPAAFGVMLYYFSNCVSALHVQLTGAEDDAKVEVLGYFVDHFVKNKEMYMVMLIFALVVVGASLVYRLSFPFSHYAAVGVGVVFCLLFTVIFASVMGQTADTSAALGGSLLGLLLGLILELVKGVLDYPHAQRIQFEDDEYYYYVKAVPKLDAPIRKEKKKRPQPKGKPQGDGQRRTGEGPNRGAAGPGPNRGAAGPGPNRGAEGQRPDRGAAGQGPNRGAAGQGPNRGAAGQGPNRGPAGQGPNRGPAGQGPNRGPAGQGPNRGPAGQGPDRGAAGPRPNRGPEAAERKGPELPRVGRAPKEKPVDKAIEKAMKGGGKPAPDDEFEDLG